MSNCLRSFVVLAALLACACAASALFLGLFNWSVPLHISEAMSPAGGGSLVLVTDNSSFAGSAAWVYARDPDHADRRPRLIGGPYASDGQVVMREAVWSKDGSEVAVRAEIAEGSCFVAAYDFRENRIDFASLPIRARSKAIARLLRQRGGNGKKILRTPYGASGQPMTRRRLQKYPTPRE